MRQYAGFEVGRRDQRPLPLPARPRPDRPQRRLRPAHPDGVRLRPPDGRRRGRQGRGGDRLPGRHAAAVRGHPPRPGLHLHDHQRPGGRLLLLYQLVGEEQGSTRPPSPARSRTTCSRSTSPAAPTSTRRRRRCGSPPTCSPTAPSTCPSTPSPSPATTWPRRGDRRPGDRLHPVRRHRLCAGGGGRRPGRGRVRAPAGLLLRGPDDPVRGGGQVRAARRIWADTMATRFGPRPRSRMLRFHTQTAGVQLRQQPLNNVVRVAVQGLAAVLGSTQSLHTNAYDEALALPSEAAARLALRPSRCWPTRPGSPTRSTRWPGRTSWSV